MYYLLRLRSMHDMYMALQKNQRDFKKARDAEIAISVFSRHARSSRGDIISSFTRYDIRLTLQNLCAYFSWLSL